MVFGQPALVRVGTVGIAGTRQLQRRALVRDINNRQRVRIAVKRNLPATVGRIRPGITDDLRVVGITVAAKSPGGERAGRVAEINEVEAAAEVLGADHIGKAGSLVDHNVVPLCKTGEVRGFAKADRRAGNSAQLREVKHLHAVTAVIVGHDIGMVGIDLDITPGSIASVRGKEPQVQRVYRIGDVDKRRPVTAPDQCILAVVQRIGPSPDVIAANTCAGTHVGQGQLREEFNIM